MAAAPDPAAVEAWAASGAMALTGRADGPALGPPALLVARLRAVADRLGERTADLGQAVDVDPIATLALRAAAIGGTRQGTTSVGGACRLIPAGAGWVAISLARPDDIDLMPAWLESSPDADPWATTMNAFAEGDGAVLVAQGADLGLPVATLPVEPPSGDPVTATRLGDASHATALEGLVVLDLAALWAGPLCGSLLALAGARVIKVESTSRPDGARSGPPAFFDVLNQGKQSVALDLAAPEGRQVLSRLVAASDVVIEGSRPRALEQMGIHAERLVADDGPRVWASITGHGRDAPGRNRVGFGDDAAVAGGLVAWDELGPCFCADAVADPATGLVAALAVLDALATGDRWVLDIALARVAAHLAGPTLPVEAGVVAGAPSAPRPTAMAPLLGADTERVLADLEISP